MSFKQSIFKILFLVLILAPGVEARDRIVVLKISGAINPAVAEFATREIENANQDGEQLIVLQMDTPGGLDTSMRAIIKEIEKSQVPVATYVSPSGSRAASAGTFITIASHIAAMAPGTNIGAAHPVNLMGGNQKGGAMEDKIVNDAAAYIRSLAELRGRNAYWAETAVKNSASISAEEAKKLAVIDLIAASMDALLLALEGREVSIGSEKIILQTAGKPVVFKEMTKRQKMLDLISNPNVAYMLLMLGLVGLYFEMSNPGLILPGVVGGLSLILALYGMQTLPVNYAGLLLILLGVILFIAEVNVMSYGLLSVGGAISLYLGSVMLIDSDDPNMQISRAVLFPTMAVSLLIAGGVFYLAMKAHERRPVSGIDSLIGEKAKAKTELNPEGSVSLHGETWRAECEGRIEAGATVVVEAVEGLKVKVKKA
ncbi:MAG: nodulation protein NfeD [Nitrospinales bacterium]